jgi:hypothetical protein
VNLFGSHQFAAGQDFTVQLGLTDRADSSCHYQMADQMRWVFEPTPPVNRARPTISGLAVQGQTLAESHGDWTNDPGSYSYRWERCGVSGGGCTPIPGATEQSYTLTAADVGHTILVEETAENPSGATAAVSLPTGVAAAAGSTDGSGTGGTGGGSADANPARIRYAYRATRRWTRFSALSISRVVAGGTIAATCRGGGCPRRALRVAGKREARLHRFIGRRLRPGAKLRIAVSGPGVATRRFTLTVRAARAPKLS